MNKLTLGVALDLTNYHIKKLTQESVCLRLAFPRRFELLTFRLGGKRSIQLSYENTCFSFSLRVLFSHI